MLAPTPSVRLAAATAELPLDAAPLTIAALSLDDPASHRLLLISADFIWFPDALAERLRTEIARRGGSEPASVVLAASHTHGSPQPDTRFPFGRQDQEWTERLEAAVLDAASAALASPATPVSLHLGRAEITTAVAVNRRRAAWYRDGAMPKRRMQSLPNEARPVDPRISVIAARDGSGKIRALIVHAVCHPVALPRDVAGADYPGVIRAQLQARYGMDVPVLFVQGHCGDVRPRLIRRPAGAKDRLLELLIGPRFRPSREGDAEWMGTAMAEAAVSAIEAARPVAADFAAVRGRVPLRDDAGTPAGRDLDVTAWRLAPDLALVATSGEMLSGLASSDPGVLSLGYANGMAGYIAPAAEYPGGGYEIDGFLKSFGLKRRFSPDTEQLFVAERARLLAAVGASVPRPTEATPA